LPHIVFGGADKRRIAASDMVSATEQL